MKQLAVPEREKWPKGWSYSSYGMFKSCMYKYYHIRILGMKETEVSYALQRGIKEHSIAEQYLKGQVKSLPKQFGSIKAEYAALKKAGPVVEQFWGVDDKWKPVNYNSWSVMKMDAAVPPSRMTENILFIQDLKTGREYPNHFDQGELYVCIGFALYPKADGVEASFWYMDQGYTITHEFDMVAIKAATKKWIERGKEVMSPRKKWPTSPSRDTCRYCFLRADKGGPCHDFED